MTIVSAFDHHMRTRIVFAARAVERLGALVKEFGGRRCLLVTDPGVNAAGHPQQVRQVLEAAGLAVAVFDQVHENPTTRDADACLEVARQANVDLIVGLGGGSSLDTAKACNFLLTNGGHMVDYWGVGRAQKPMLPFVAVPTTAGTGSECQSFALIADATTHQKMACGDSKAAAAVAVLDPTLTLTQPRRVTACTGIDALTHAVESYVATNRNPVSKMYAAESLRLTLIHLPAVLNNEADLDARGGMLLAAAFAGIAIENSMLGAAHAAANPLTAHFGLTHGHAVGLMLPHVIGYNAQNDEVRTWYAELAGIDGNIAQGGDPVEALVRRITDVFDAAGLAPTLAAAGIETSKVAVNQLAEEAASQWTARFNPRPIARDDFVSLYQAAWGA